MEPCLLTLGLFTFIMVPGYATELCAQDPPEISHATFKAHTYKAGTILNCECKKGFRRIKNGSPYLHCIENSSWGNKCQCVSTSPINTTKKVTLQPEEQKERKTTEMQSQMQSVDPVSLPGHCREPPPWDHEGAKRIYHFTVGQTVHYQCMQGYKARQRGPAISICQTTHGKTGWTQPRLTCENETQHHPSADEEVSQVSTDPLPESETSGSITPTDFQTYTEATTTMDTFILTVEYQIAVAGCVFLLISTLLLSGLTWKRRCYSPVIEQLQPITPSLSQSGPSKK
ncbi:interleukin-2 receptor subunit alpha [Ctenodactylus gundi]